MTRKIDLVNSDQKALVDDDDYEFIDQYTWFEVDGYAVTYDFGEPIEMGSLVMARAQSINN